MTGQSFKLGVNSFEKTLSQLSSIGVVTRPAPGMLDLADWVRELL